MSEYTGAQDIEFTHEWQRTIGGLRLIIGSIGTEGGRDQAFLYAAAFSQRDLHKDRCGYGTTEKEAVADFFRYLRVDTKNPFNVDF